MAASVHPLRFQAAPLADEQAYAKALDELEDLFLAESGTPEARRFDVLVDLIEQYEARQRVYLLGTRHRRDARA
jgi:antitoxin component HigA of HigAB toxin-antitoxin module